MSRPAPGAIGCTITPLTPEGDITVDGRDYFARSVDGHVPAGANIVVTESREHCVLVSAGALQVPGRSTGTFFTDPSAPRGVGAFMADPPAPRVGDGAFTSGPQSRQISQATRPEGAEADADFAARRLRAGAPPPEVEEQLTASGGLWPFTPTRRHR
jgi:hypothetical protein